MLLHKNYLTALLRFVDTYGHRVHFTKDIRRLLAIQQEFGTCKQRTRGMIFLQEMGFLAPNHANSRNSR